MRIAVIADIHGNLGALDAVLADIEGQAVERTVNLGDVVSGPLQPCETADRLMNLAITTISGNHERQLLTFPRENLGESDRFATEQCACPISVHGLPDFQPRFIWTERCICVMARHRGTSTISLTRWMRWGAVPRRWPR